MQFLWWEILLVRQSNLLISEKQNLVALSSSNDEIILHDIKDLENKKTHRMFMIVGEGTVFLLILLFGVYKVRQSIKKETQLAHQQNNFLLSVSHELKTPIAASKLQLQTLLKHALDRPKQLELLTNALYETDRLNKLVENVLLANQIQNKNIALAKEDVNVGELVKQTVSRYFKNELDSGKINLNIEPAVFSIIDKDLFPSIVINLVENALKYSMKNPLVEVSVQLQNQKPLLKITDNGVGISDENKTLVFEKFYRVGSEEVRKTKGTGLGLYIVKYICDIHSAKISISNNYPSGTIFSVELC